MREDLGELRNQRGVHDHGVVIGVGGDVADLSRREPDIQRVQHRAHRRHRQVGLEVLGVVPHEGPHALIGVHAQPPQGVGQPRGAAARLGVGAAPGPVPGPGDDLAITEYRGPVAHDRRDRQRDVHYRAAHLATSYGC
jgi:hypothetical protein